MSLLIFQPNNPLLIFQPNNLLFSPKPSQSQPPLLPTLNETQKPSRIQRRLVLVSAIPARDRVIDFGRHKGKMLGALPSKYLKWVSKKLRARDFEEWARLADEVLEDPVYRDRLEWEFAERVLTGEEGSGGLERESSVLRLLEIGERFGWDNDDKVGWKRIDFSLLGTSKGGRIPKKGFDCERNLDEVGADLKREEKVEGSIGGGRRVERRERQRLKRDAQLEKLDKLDKLCKDGVFDVENRRRHYDNQNGHVKGNSGHSKLFPGREALLRSVIDSRKLL